MAGPAGPLQMLKLSEMQHIIVNLSKNYIFLTNLTKCLKDYKFPHLTVSEKLFGPFRLILFMNRETAIP